MSAVPFHARDPGGGSVPGVQQDASPMGHNFFSASHARTGQPHRARRGTVLFFGEPIRDEAARERKATAPEEGAIAGRPPGAWPVRLP